MSEADSESTQQCRALTNSGDRCQNSASENGFCHQHNESDPTVDDADASTDTADADKEEAAADGGVSETEEDSESADEESESADEEAGSADADEAESTTDETDDSAASDDATADEEETAEQTDDSEMGEQDEADDVSVAGAGSLMDVRATVKQVSAELIERPLDGVVEISNHNGEWRATVEVVERRAVPDTQDIIGQYELQLEDPQTVTGYRRLTRFRRSDTERDQPLE